MIVLLYFSGILRSTKCRMMVVQMFQPAFEAVVFLVMQNSDYFNCTYKLLCNNDFILMFRNYEGR